MIVSDQTLESNLFPNVFDTNIKNKECLKAAAIWVGNYLVTNLRRAPFPPFRSHIPEGIFHPLLNKNVSVERGGWWWYQNAHKIGFKQLCNTNKLVWHKMQLTHSNSHAVSVTKYQCLTRKKPPKKYIFLSIPQRGRRQTKDKNMGDKGLKKCSIQTCASHKFSYFYWKKKTFPQ